MILPIPAIDIINGQCVRLEKGDYSQMSIYSDSPLDMALYWEGKRSDASPDRFRRCKNWQTS